jgi:nicotinamidase-related amidase
MLLQERYCPGCGVTLDAAVVEVDDSVGERKASESAGPQTFKLDAATTAVVVLDLNKSSYDPKHPSYPLFEPARDFLERARSASVPIVFTVVVWEKDTPAGAVADPLGRRESEPVLYPNGYDKFVDGDLQNFLQRWGSKNLVFLGGSANFALLYTATTAVRTYGYSVVIPMDGIYARSTYEMEYSLYQFTVLPRVANKFRFTKLASIEFS